MKHLVEAVHSKWGAVKLEMERNPHEVLFLYPDGAFMGSLDREGGGNLNHPNVEADKFMRFYFSNSYLLELDEEGYIELEKILISAAHKVWPSFFQPEILLGRLLPL